jgi:hypothetical protein
VVVAVIRQVTLGLVAPAYLPSVLMRSVPGSYPGRKLVPPFDPCLQQIPKHPDAERLLPVVTDKLWSAQRLIGYLGPEADELPDGNGVADPKFQGHEWEIVEKVQKTQHQQVHSDMY